MSNPCVCTIAAPNYLPFVRLLARSLARTNPDLPLICLTVSGDRRRDSDSVDNAAFIKLAELHDPRIPQMRRRYGRKALCAALKPMLLRHLLARGGPVLFLDPDVLVTASLRPVIDIADASPLTLCPHLTHPERPLGLGWVERTLLRAGMYNAGFVAVSNRPGTTEFLDWWADRTATHCLGDTSSGYHYDQRWLDLAPGFVPDMQLLRDPGCNLGHWNLPSRSLSNGDKGILVDGAPLRFFHFSGFNPARPDRLSHFAPEETVTGTPLEPLFAQYATDLRAAGLRRTRRPNTHFNRIMDSLRRMRPWS